MNITLISIGIIHSPFIEPSQAPIQASRSNATGSVEVFPEFAEGLRDIQEFSHIFLLYLIDCPQGYNLQVQPFLDDQEHGIFATRYPCRPNPIGLSIVHLLRIEGNRLDIEGIDMLDNTPLIDIKPYVPEFDNREDVRVGWYNRRAHQ
ncbi:MAG: tRNA (N6-threonylcarbamoyladenosine(37)-N6)-methyltransferase TrmO [Anaerolineales bacterium]